MWVKKDGTILELNSVSVVGSRIEFASASGMRIVLSPEFLSGESRRREKASETFTEWMAGHIRNFVGFLDLDTFDFSNADEIIEMSHTRR